MELSHEIGNVRCSQSPSSTRRKLSASPALFHRFRILSLTLNFWVSARLPREIWDEIFLRCLPSDYSHPSIKEAPLLLCRVSRKWRKNAQDTKALWTTLFAHFDLAEKPMLFRTGLGHWLSRASPRRLTLVLKVSMPSRGSKVEPPIKREFDSLLSYIAQNAERFRVISVTDEQIHPGVCFTPPVASPALWGERIMQVVNDHSHKFTNLISFNYCRTYYFHQHPLLATMDPPFQLPQSVRMLVLNPGPIDIPHWISPIPTLQHVVHLDLQGYSLTPSEFLQQLAFCPRIITGLFTISGNNDLVPVTTPVRLEQLRSLTLYPMIHEGNLEFLGTHIDGLSNTLTELFIDSMVKPSPTLNSTALTPHRSERLTALALMDLDVITQDLIAFLTNCRALQSLYIKLPSILETEIVYMLERTTDSPESLGVLPILKKFSIFIYMDLRTYVPLFFEQMVKSRRNETLLRDSACLIEAVDLIHLGVGGKPEVNQLRESLEELTGFDFKLNIEERYSYH
jgi:hypothetical protein